MNEQNHTTQKNELINLMLDGGLKWYKTMIKKYAEKTPELSEWRENNIPEGLTIFTVPKEVRKRLRTFQHVRISKQSDQPSDKGRWALPQESFTSNLKSLL